MTSDKQVTAQFAPSSQLGAAVTKKISKTKITLTARFIFDNPGRIVFAVKKNESKLCGKKQNFSSGGDYRVRCIIDSKWRKALRKKDLLLQGRLTY